MLRFDGSAGEPGATAGGVLGLIGIAFTITGFLLWWRARRSFRPRVLPEGMSRSQIVRHHRDIGTLTSPLLILTLLTGSLLTLRPVADFLFSPLSSPGTIAESLAPPKTEGGALAANFDWGATDVRRRTHSDSRSTAPRMAAQRPDDLLVRSGGRPPRRCRRRAISATRHEGIQPGLSHPRVYGRRLHL